MKTQKYLLLVTFSGVTFSGDADSNNIVNSDTMVVSANRFPQPVMSVLAPVVIVSRHDIERWQAKSIDDILRRLPGIDIAKLGGLGQQSSVFIRGTNSNHVLVLVDGIRLNQAGITGSSDLSQLPLSLVQRIEYIPGPRSAVYGSDAIGGVINIISGCGEAASTLTASLGSGGYQRYDGATQQQLGHNTTATLAGNYTYTNGYDVIAEGNTGGNSQTDRDGFMGKTLWVGLEHQFNSQLTGFTRAWGFDNRSGYDGFYSPGMALLDTRQLYSRTYDSGLRFRNGVYASQWIASYSRTKDYNYDPEYGRYAASATLDNVQQYNVQWANIWQIPRGNIGAGIDWQKQITEPGTNYLPEGYGQRNGGIYSTALQLIGPVTLEGAVRADANSQFGWHATWQGSASWEFVTGYRLIGSYGTAYKAPNLGQLYSSQYGNQALKPEESQQWEAALVGGAMLLDWRLSIYHNDINNLIEGDKTSWRYHNIGKAKINGVEWTGIFDTGSLTHEASLGYLEPLNSETNEILLRRAKQQVKYQLNWRVVGLDWSVTYQYIGRRYDKIASGIVKLSNISLWDLALSYPATSHFTIRARIANLFGKDYETVYGYQTPGREYYLTGSYTF